jgi:hypothetical protein
VEISLRKNLVGKATANQLLSNEGMFDILRHDDGFKVLKNLVNSPPFWQKKMRVLMAMIRQLGVPTFFFSFSAAEVQ